MKVKLLKKIRKTYSWYFNQNNDPVLVNHNTGEIITIDVEYVMKHCNYSSQQEMLNRLKVTIDVYLQRHLLKYLLEKVGIIYRKNLYYRLTRKYWSLINGKRRIPKIF